MVSGVVIFTDTVKKKKACDKDWGSKYFCSVVFRLLYLEKNNKKQTKTKNPKQTTTTTTNPKENKKLKEKRSNPKIFKITSIIKSPVSKWTLLANACESFLVLDPHSLCVQETVMAVFVFIVITGKDDFHLLGLCIKEIEAVSGEV